MYSKRLYVCMICLLGFVSSASANNSLQGIYMLFKDQSAQNCRWNSKGTSGCAGVNLQVLRSGSSWIGKMVHIPSSASAAYQGKGAGWIAFNVRPNLNGPSTCRAGSANATLLYGSVFDKRAGHSRQGYILVSPDSNGSHLYFMPGVTNPVLANGQCNNRATYGQDQFWQVTSDISAQPWKK